MEECLRLPNIRFNSDCLSRCAPSTEENVPGVFSAPYAGEGESNPAANESPLWQGVSAPVILLSGDGHVASM